MPHVYSTLSADNAYTTWKKSASDGSVIEPEKKVLIKGGTGVVRKDQPGAPLGVRTEVSESDLAHLMENESFKTHMKNKYIVVHDKNFDAEVVAADMETADGGAQITEHDIPENVEGDGKIEVSVGKKSKG